MIAMQTQFEQQSNASNLKSMGLTVLKKLKKKYHPKTESRISKSKNPTVNYAENASQVVKEISHEIPSLIYKTIQPLDINFDDDRYWFV